MVALRRQFYVCVFNVCVRPARRIVNWRMQFESESATLDTDICVTVQGPQIGAGNRFLADGGALIAMRHKLTLKPKRSLIRGPYNRAPLNYYSLV